ncbi:MAG: AraC family transcriptional regulator [Rhodocyclaceae bacterium]
MSLSFAAHRRKMCGIRHINNFIGAHLDDDITLEDIADAAHMSQAHLVRFYSSCVGESPMQALRRLRLRRAFGHIEQGRFARITDVGFAAGYGSSAAFTHAFRKEFGFAPSDVPSVLPVKAAPPPLRLECVPERKVYRFAYEGVFAENGYFKARMMWLCHMAERDALLSWRVNDRDHPFSERGAQHVRVEHFVPVSDQTMVMREADLVTQAGGLYAVTEVMQDTRSALLKTLDERIREELGCRIIEGHTMDRDIHERAYRTPQERCFEMYVPVTPVDARGHMLAAVATARA